MAVIQDIYLISCGVGFVYIVGSALMGTLHTGGHSVGHAGHAGAGHGGAIGHGGGGHAAIGHGGGHPAAIGHGGGHAGTGGGHSAGMGHGGGGHTAAGQGGGAAHAGGSGHAAGSPHAGGSGHGAGPSHGGGHAAGHQGPGHQAPAQQTGVRAGGKAGSDNYEGHSDEVLHALSQSTSAVNPASVQVPSVYLKILDLLSPTKLAFFAFLFGAFGFVGMKFLPGYLSMAPAAIGGWIIANWFFHLLGNVMQSMNSSSNFRIESLIGSLGELTLSVPDGGVGEVLVTTGSSRYTARARANSPGKSINKLTKVIVVDIKDGIFLVEPFEDLDLTEKE